VLPVLGVALLLLVIALLEGDSPMRSLIWER